MGCVVRIWMMSFCLLLFISGFAEDSCGASKKKKEMPGAAASAHIGQTGGPRAQITILKSSQGNVDGTVASVNVLGINCGSSCIASFPSGTMVTLYVESVQGTPMIGKRAVFAGWEGVGCSSRECTVALTNDLQVTAKFGYDQTGSGVDGETTGQFGTVVAVGDSVVKSFFSGMASPSSTDLTAMTASVSSPFTIEGLTNFSISPGQTLGANSAPNNAVQIRFTPTAVGAFDAHPTFTWSGSGPDFPYSRSIEFVGISKGYALFVNVSGTGSGTITGDFTPCTNTCKRILNNGGLVMVTAAPGGSSIFTGWNGCSSVNGAQCTVALPGSVTASFALQTFGLTVSTAGTGSGTITCKVNDVATACAGPFPVNTVVMLIPTAGSGSLFSSWSGDPDCSDGQVIMTAVKSCTANFSAAAAPPTARLIAISTRSVIQAVTLDQEGSAMIAGFVISGNSPKTVVIRARGPSLAPFGVQGALPDPFVKVLSGQTTRAQNDDWQVSDPTCANTGNQCGTAADITNAGLSPCSPNTAGCEKEAAIYITLSPGAYTAIARGASGSPGIGLVEVYEVDATPATLAAISTRSVIQAVSLEQEGSAMIAGFSISGDPGTHKTVVVRVRGPALVPFGVQGALSDPFVKILSGQTTLAQNDDWQVADPTCANSGQQCGTATDIANAGLSPCSPNVTGCEKEAAIHIRLAPGAYTAIARGASGTPGIGLIEVFDVGN